MKLINIKKEDKQLSIEELLNNNKELTFENDLTRVVLIKTEDGFNAVGYAGYDIDFDMDQLDDVLEIINDIKNSSELFSDWADDYLHSIENYEFRVTENCINSIYLAREIQMDKYTHYTNYNTSIRAVANEVIEDYFNYIDELLGEL